MGLREIAQRAGVSVMTVSRVLNGKGNVAEPTRRRVLVASRELGVFLQNRGRRSSKPKTQRDNVALLIDTDVASAFLSELIGAIQPCLARRGFQCTLQMFSGDHGEFLRALTAIRPTVVDACVAVGHFPDDEARGILGANPRTVFVDYMPSPDLGAALNVVSYDNVTACHMATRQLRLAGCVRTVCLQGRPNHHFSRAMRQGYLSAMEKRDFGPGELLTADFTSEGGYRAMSAALSSAPPPDGVFATDEMAMGAMRAAKEHGLAVPRDVQVMGCDGIDFGRELHPPLSTVVLDRRALGERAVERVLELIQADELTHETVLLPPRLELRGSCVPQGDPDVLP